MGQDFSLVTACGPPNTTLQVLVSFFALWPFITLMFLRRGRSPLPLLAMLLPLALAGSATWLGLSRVIERMAVSGAGIGPALAAGIAEALLPAALAIAPAVLVAIVALARGHRPAVDHFTLVAALAAATEIIAALLFTGFLAPERRQAVLALIWCGTALVLSLAIAARIVVLTSRPVQ